MKKRLPDFYCSPSRRNFVANLRYGILVTLLCVCSSLYAGTRPFYNYVYHIGGDVNVSDHLVLKTSLHPADYFIKSANTITAPTIDYGGPLTFFTNKAISPVSPQSTGVADAGYSSVPLTVANGFNFPLGMAADAAGNIYIADTENNVVKKIPVNGGSIVTVGSGFNLPFNVAVNAAGDVFVADYGNKAIKKVPVNGGSIVTLGSGFDQPQGVAVDAAGNVYVSDPGNSNVYKIPVGSNTPVVIGTGFQDSKCVAVDVAGNVYAGGVGFVKKIPAGGGSPVTVGATAFQHAFGIVIDTSGNVFVSDDGANKVVEFIKGAGNPVTIGSGFSSTTGIAINSSGDIFVADPGHSSVSRVSPVGGYYISPALPAGLNFDNNTGIISGTPTVAGPGTNYTITGYNNTAKTTAVLNISVKASVVAPQISYASPQIYVLNNTISPLTPANTGGAVPATIYGQVSTFAGSTEGYANGTGTAARFNEIRGVCSDPAGNVFVADENNQRIRKITPAGLVSTYAGSGGYGSVDGPGASATFNDPKGMAADGLGNVYVGQPNDDTIRKISTSRVVSTFSPHHGTKSMTTDAAGNVYVADDAIYKITPAGVVTTYYSGGNGDGIVADAAGNVYFTDYNVIKKITPAKVVTTLAGGASSVVDGTGTNAGFESIENMTIDQSGNIYVIDQYSIRKITMAGEVTTVAGGLEDGSANGVGAAAGFANPYGITADQFGNVYIGDTGNDAVRKITVTGYTINPALPAGLSFDVTTGIISGTPTAVTPAMDYVITAYNAGGSSRATVHIQVTLNANLASLQVNAGTLSPAFTSATNNYSVTVSAATSSVTITPGTADQQATVKVNGTAVASGNPSAPIALNFGANTIATVVTAQDGVTTKTYTVTVTRTGSSVATLASLHLSNGALTPLFAAGTTSYAASVGNSVASVTVTAKLSDATAKLTVNGSAVTSNTPSGTIALTPGPNTINVVVTAQDGTTTKTYTITLTRAYATNAALSALSLNTGSLSPQFIPATTSYTQIIATSVTAVRVKPVSADATATIKVNGATVASGGTSAVISLSADSTLITTVVTAQDGVTNKTYSITVKRPSTNAGLSALSLSTGSISPQFATATTGYTETVANTVTAVRVKATAADATATILVNGVKTTSGGTSAAITLAVGANTVTSLVTAQDGKTKQTYTITVTRAAAALNTVYEPVAVDKPESRLGINEEITVHPGVSPNGDGQNDVLTIDNIKAYPENSLKIMNRNGELVYEAKGYDNSTNVFDGHSNKTGKMQAPGTYFYSLDYAVKGVVKYKTGFVVLKW